MKSRERSYHADKQFNDCTIDGDSVACLVFEGQNFNDAAPKRSSLPAGEKGKVLSYSMAVSLYQFVPVCVAAEFEKLISEKLQSL